MEDLKGKTSYGWVELTDMVSDPTDLTTGRGGIALVGTALKYYNKTEWVTLEAGESTNHKLLSATHTDTTAGDVARGDIITGQGATAKWTKLAKGTNGQLLTMGAEEPGWATLSGVANANIAANAAIDWSKMATSTDIHTDGTVKALSIGSPNAGDVLRYVGSAWTVVDPATLPGGTASGLAQNVTIEAGTYDLTLKTTAQTSSAADLTIPDFAGENQTIALIGLAQTLTNKTLTSPVMGTSIVLDQTTADYTIDWDDPAAARAITFGDPGGDDDIAYLAATQALTNKTVNRVTITAPASGSTLTIADGKTLTASASITLAGTDAKTLTVDDDTTIGTDAITFAGTEALTLAAAKDVTFADEFETSGEFKITLTATGTTSVTLPTSGTLVSTDSTATLTNKTFDCDGTGNVLSNIEANELKNVADAGMGVPFVIRKTLANLPEAGTNVLGTTHPKLRVIDVWFVATSADSGTVQLKVGQTGSIGAAITDAITIAAADKGISRATTLDDAAWEVAANTGLVAVGDAGASVDGELFVMAIRVA